MWQIQVKECGSWQPARLPGPSGATHTYANRRAALIMLDHLYPNSDPNRVRLIQVE